jgi:hypothetical protein
LKFKLEKRNENSKFLLCGWVSNSAGLQVDSRMVIE